ncbi:MAG: hypothetical protein EPO02_04570 [Nitrospirae bacterium]|nr:MAG: hypothetical protein EPO02_04570 [Nitrospirota bacterium]
MDEQPKQPDEQRPGHEEDTEGERHIIALTRFVGFIMMVLGWLQLLLAVSSGSEATSFPFVIFFIGVVLFVFGTVTAWYKFPLMAAATLTGLALHYHISSIGSATRWEKAMVVYGTIAVVAYFILIAKKQPVRRINLPPSQE